MTSAVRHFTAGVVFAAVAGEVLPDLRSQHSLWPLVAGFVGGVAVLLVIDGFARRAEYADDTGLPVPLPVAIAIDLVIDGPSSASAPPSATAKGGSSPSP